MSMDKHDDEPSAASTKSLEIATALFFLVIGGLVMWDSYRIGAKWGDDAQGSAARYVIGFDRDAGRGGDVAQHVGPFRMGLADPDAAGQGEIGRASCRERV